MDISKIVELQQRLDRRIYNKFDLIESSTFSKRKLALIVELSELANEVRCFKFWSLKEPSSNNIILEEFVDCFHFIVSLGLTMHADFMKVDFKDNSCDSCLTTQFTNIISMCSNLTIENLNLYYDLFNEINTLAFNLGFTSNEIYDAYISKNEVNHLRQDNDY